jgi:hypothetical protein
MFGLETLDMLIGLITVYLTFGIACTAIVETVAAWLSLRSRNLEAALKEFLVGDLTSKVACKNRWAARQHICCLARGDVLVRPPSGLYAGARSRCLASRENPGELHLYPRLSPLQTSAAHLWSSW